MNAIPSVLVVEDDADARELLLRALVDSGIPALGVRDVAQALAALEAVSYDVLLSDVMMPGQTGIDLVRAVRERGSDVSVVLVTAYASVKLLVEAMRLGVAEVLEKPARMAQVVEVVERVHRRREHERAAIARASDLRRSMEDLERRSQSRVSVLSRAVIAARAAGSAEAAMEDLAEYILSEAGDLVVARSQVAPEKVADLCVREALRLRPDVARCIEVTGQGDVRGPLSVDPSRVAGVVGRLLACSSRVAPGGRVRLAFRAHERDLLVTVSDAGEPPPRELAAGPPFAVLERIASWSRAEGAELARLLAVHGLCRAMGAWISLKALEPRGACWEIRLPGVVARE